MIGSSTKEIVVAELGNPLVAGQFAVVVSVCIHKVLLVLYTCAAFGL